MAAEVMGLVAGALTLVACSRCVRHSEVRGVPGEEPGEGTAARFSVLLCAHGLPRSPETRVATGAPSPGGSARPLPFPRRPAETGASGPPRSGDLVPSARLLGPGGPVS